jgi:hypothetical protein
MTQTTAARLPRHDDWQTLVEVELAGETDNAQKALSQVEAAIQALQLPTHHIEQVRQALARTLANAQGRRGEHGRRWLTMVRVMLSSAAQAKQSSGQSWGFFLLERQARMTNAEPCCLIQVFLYQEGLKHQHEKHHSARAPPAAREQSSS